MQTLRLSTLLLAAAAGPSARIQPAQATSAIEQQFQSVARMKAAIDQQRATAAATMATVSRQRELIPASLAPPPLVLPPWPAMPMEVSDLPCPPIPEHQVRPIIESAARAHNVEADLIRAVIAQESNFRPCAVSSKGAQGLMQLMPATAQQLQVRDPFDPAENVNAGARMLRQLLTTYGGDLARALGAYNAGPANVPRAGALPDFPETRSYVGTILNRLAAIE